MWLGGLMIKPQNQQIAEQTNRNTVEPSRRQFRAVCPTPITWLATEHDFWPGSRLWNNPAVRMAYMA